MKWYIYLICFALMIVGAFCGIRLYELVTRESYINGSIDIQNQFSQESFAYANTSVEFYNDIYDTTNTYCYEIDLLKSPDFNGTKNRYQLVLNDYILINVQISAGAVFSKAYLDFYDTNGNIICSTSLDIAIKFLSDKTTLTLSTTGGENAGFLTRYFKDNGIRLKINKLIPQGKSPATTPAAFVPQPLLRDMIFVGGVKMPLQASIFTSGSTKILK